MARKRMLSPMWAKHADLYDAEIESGLPLRVAFAALWTVTDRRGVFAWSRNLKPDVLPYDACDMLAVLAALAAGGFVERYEVDGKPYGLIPSFELHQHFHKDEKPSTLPGPPAPEEHRAPAVPAPGQRDGSTAPNGLIANSDIRHTETSSQEEEEAASSSSEEERALLAGLGATQRASWAAELRVAREGMHGRPIPDAQIASACRDFVSDGHLANPKLAHFRGYLARAAARPVMALSSTAPPDDDDAVWSSALEVIGKLTHREMDAVGYNAMPASLRAAFKAVGGWTALRDVRQTDLPFRRKDFLAAYRRAEVAEQKVPA